MQITDEEFNAIRDFLYNKTGVLLRETKKPLVISRLRKRVDELNLRSFGDYVKVLHQNRPDELEYFSNALTTNETFFFRHTKQFNYLFEKILPEIKAGGHTKINIWSAACSSGDEPYSISIALEEFKQKGGPDFQIYASDINTEVIEEAKEGIYQERAIKDVPETLLQKYFKIVQENNHAKSYQVLDSIKRKVRFFQHNLKFPYKEKIDFDIIFLRNVLIYFDRETKELVVNLLESNLKKGGYFFISLSENLNDIKTGLYMRESGIFQK